MAMKAILVLAAVALMATPFASIAETIEVPSERDLPSDAMAIASSGDTVLVSWAIEDSTWVAYDDTLTIKSGVDVIAKSGTTPIIDGGSLKSVAVEFESGASSSTLLEGFTVRGGTSYVTKIRGSAVIRDCTIENEGAANRLYGIHSDGSTTIDNCTITMSGNQKTYGIYHIGGSPDIRDCTIEIEAGDSSEIGIYVNCPSATTTGTIQDCTVTMNTGVALSVWKGAFTVSGMTVAYDTADYDNIGMYLGVTTGDARGTVKDCLISVPDGVGVFVADDSVKVTNLTITDVGTGIWEHRDVDASISNCIVTDYNDGTEYAYESVDAVYCIGDGTTPYESGSQGTGSVIQDPLYCDASGAEYTLRVDSYGSPENNASGERIGAFDVACIYGTLQRTAEYAGDGTLDFPGDATIPSGKTLTIGAGTTFNVADSADSEASGSDTLRTELIVNGTLDVNGTSGSGVLFQSSGGTPAETDWRGIVVSGGGTADLDYATIKHAFRGFSVSDSADLDIGNVNIDVVTDGIYALGTATCDVDSVTIDASDTAIELRGTSSATLNDVTAVGGEYGLGVFISDPSATAADCVFEGTGTAGVYAYRGDVTIWTSTTRNSETGVWAAGSSEVTYKSGTIDDCDWGAWVDGTAKLELGQASQSTAHPLVISDCDLVAIGIDSDTAGNSVDQVKIEASNVSNWTGVQVFDGADATLTLTSVVTPTAVTATGVVGFLIEDEATLRAPEVEGLENGTGIVVNADSLATVLIDSTAVGRTPTGFGKISNCKYGIDVQGYSRPKVRNAAIEDHSTCVHIGPAAQPDLGEDASGKHGGNRIADAASRGRLAGGLTRLGGIPDVKAEHNYWGSSPTWSKISSWVDYQPYDSSNPLPTLTARRIETEAAPPPALLLRAHPTPFSRSLEIQYELPVGGGTVRVEVFDVRGRLVRTLISDTQAAGVYAVTWDGRGRDGQTIRSGVYFLRAVTPYGSATTKLVRVD